MKRITHLIALFCAGISFSFAAAQEQPPREGRPAGRPEARRAQGRPAAPPAEAKPVALEDGAAQIGPENAMIQFVGTHAGEDPNPRVGKFEKFSGTATVEDGKLTAVVVEIETGSLSTPIPDLTNHLKSPDFFDAREHPKAKFESTKVTAGEGDSYEVTGNLTLLGNTQEVSFPAQVAVGDDGITLDGKTTLDRTAFGMDKMTQRVNKEIELAMAIGKTEAAGGPGGPRGPRGEGRGGRGGFDPEAMFKSMDADGDGKLTKEEMPERMVERLDRIDTDGDGSVTMEELMKRMRARGGGGRGPRGGGEGGERPERPRRPQRPGDDS